MNTERMTAEGRFYLYLAAIIATGLVLFTAVVAARSIAVHKIAIDAGLTEGSLPGNTGTFWVKPNTEQK